MKKPLPCDRKKRYTTYDGAVAMAIVRIGSEREKPKALCVYKCPHCKGFHLTKQTAQDRRWPVIRAAA